MHGAIVIRLIANTLCYKIFSSKNCHFNQPLLRKSLITMATCIRFLLSVNPHMVFQEYFCEKVLSQWLHA